MHLRRAFVLIPALLFLGTPQPTRGDYPQEVTALVFLPDGRTLVSASVNGRLHFWDAVTGKQLRSVHAHEGGVYALKLSPDGQSLASGGADGKIRLWQALKGRELRVIAGHEKEVTCLAFSADGKQLSSGSADKTIRLWSMEDGKQLARIPHPGNGALSLTYLPGSKVLASGGMETLPPGPISPLNQSQQVHLWDLETSKRLGTLPHRSKSVAATPDGRFLVSSGDFFDISRDAKNVTYTCTYGLFLWDVVRNREAGHWKESQYTLSISKDGRWLASGVGTTLHCGGMTHSGDDRRGIQLRELATGEVVWQATAVWTLATVAAISPDRRRLAVGSVKGLIEFHSLAPRKWQAKKVNEDELARAWGDLARDPVSAYQALWDLSGDPDSATTFLKGKLKLASPADPPIQRLVSDLDSEEFAVREAATQQLRRLGVEAEPELLHALRSKPTLEVQKRIQNLLADLPVKLPPQYLRYVRALEVLERIDSRDSRRVMEELAGGAPGAWMTHRAAEAEKRLRSR